MAFERLTSLDVSNLRIERRGLPMGVAALAMLEGGALLDSSGELAMDAIRARVEHCLHLAAHSSLPAGSFGASSP